MLDGRLRIGGALFADRGIIAGVFALSILARAQSLFNPLYAVDTYSMAGQGVGDVSTLFYSQGRYGLVFVYWLRDLLGFQGYEVSVSANLAASLLMAVSGTLVAGAVLQGAKAWPRAAFALVFALHPYGTEFFHFSEAAFTIALSVAIASLGLHVAIREDGLPMRETASILLMVLALSIYQTTAAILVAACLLALVREVAERPSGDWRGLSLSAPARAFALVVASVILYGASAKAILAATGIPATSRADISPLLTPAGMVGKVRLMAWAVWKGTLQGFGLIGPAGKYLLACALAASVLFTGAALARRGASAVLLGALLAVGAFLASVMPPTISSDVWVVPRTLWAIVVPIAAFIGLGAAYAPEWGGKLLKGSVVLLCVVYLGASNRMIMDQRRVNAWDAAQANRILGRLEAQEGFAAVTALAVVGETSRLASTTVGDMNISALNVALARPGLFREAAGQRFQAASEADMAEAKVHCAASAAWPGTGSASVRGRVAVVCLGGR